MRDSRICTSELFILATESGNALSFGARQKDNCSKLIYRHWSHISHARYGIYQLVLKNHIEELPPEPSFLWLRVCLTLEKLEMIAALLRLGQISRVGKSHSRRPVKFRNVKSNTINSPPLSNANGAAHSLSKKLWMSEDLEHINNLAVGNRERVAACKTKRFSIPSFEKLLVLLWRGIDWSARSVRRLLCGCPWLRALSFQLMIGNLHQKAGIHVCLQFSMSTLKSICSKWTRTFKQTVWKDDMCMESEKMIWWSTLLILWDIGWNL